MNNKATAAIVLVAVLLVSAVGLWVALAGGTITGNAPAAVPKRAIPCTTNSQCNDFNGCTDDVCSRGVCLNTQVNCIECMPDRKCWNGGCIGTEVLPPGACGSYYYSNRSTDFLTKPGRPRPDCESMRRMSAVSGWIMKYCTFKFNPSDGTYGFAVTFGF